MPLYRVVRYYRKSGRRQIIRTGMTFADARLWCNREDTHRVGVWFDGFERERGQ